ncbi:hypothetical protein ACIF9R_09525 [Streptomyces sp. NPDC086080]|uniref:hypothetical protein n=1 Tax=Streptomyces sp. NPDC086080 TaxID=3365748 RepID=UPI0037D4F29B
MNPTVFRVSTAAALIAFALGVSAPLASAAKTSDETPVEQPDIGTVPPQEALEEDRPLADEPEETALPDREPLSLQCTPGWAFKVTKNKKNTMSVKYHTFVENKLPYAVDFKFTSKKSGTTEVGASVTVSGEIKVRILGSIKVEVNGSVKKSWTSELGIETYGKVRAKSTVYGDYGIRKENVYGYKYHRGSACQKSNKQYMTAWAPYKEGWVTYS